MKTTSKKRGRKQDYESLFLRNAPMVSRGGKTVCISKKHHERIQKVLQVIGQNEVTMASYLDNVLEQHFNTYHEEINALYRARIADEII